MASLFYCFPFHLKDISVHGIYCIHFYNLAFEIPFLLLVRYWL